MKQYLLLTSALVVISGVAEAACIQTPTCGAMGYDSTIACEGGIKCPFGNAWNCTLANEIAQLKITIEKLEQTAQEEALAKCKIGDILYHDMTCNTNMVASKTPIGVIFDVTNGLAIAKDEFKSVGWSRLHEDISQISNYTDLATVTADWQGFNNTKAMYNYIKSKGNQFSAAESTLTYTTLGTSMGQWYLPAAGELKAISDNKDVLNTTLSKIGGTQLSGTYWSSSEYNNNTGWEMSISGGFITSDKNGGGIARPVINFASKDTIYIGDEIPCLVGDAIYSDKKCYLDGAPFGKTPIGVVFDAEKRLAIALETSVKKWAEKDVKISGLTTYSTRTEAEKDYNGKNNTATIMAYAKTNNYKFPAAEYAYNYTTAGTKAGDWYLPAAGEIRAIYYEKTKLNERLTYLKKNNIGQSSLWSSSEDSKYYAWIVGFDGWDDTISERKIYSYTVLPVLAF